MKQIFCITASDESEQSISTEVKFVTDDFELGTAYCKTMNELHEKAALFLEEAVNRERRWLEENPYPSFDVNDGLEWKLWTLSYQSARDSIRNSCSLSIKEIVEDGCVLWWDINPVDYLQAHN